jgi:hypothetical protein
MSNIEKHNNKNPEKNNNKKVFQIIFFFRSLKTKQSLAATYIYTRVDQEEEDI